MSRMKRVKRTLALAAVSAAGLLMTVAATPSVAAPAQSPAPACVEYYQSWRYTDVVNNCAETVAVTVEYTNGQDAPCRVIAPGAWATFAGYGTDGNYAIAVRTCEPSVAEVTP
ncbi:alpha-amylase [Streptomyces sp. R1]|uniref:alpha-amylase n=1 Tax=Streptomyces sp. R1 TaxID=1509279 RepID=UPI001E3D450E|nr:alpha-amylase [Streptomyces sp. R1]MCC8340254.1 alpha-amylase [Streptomyces sp. R1]